MSKINYTDVDFDLDYSDEDEDIDSANNKCDRHKNRVRRRIENLMERKKLKQMMYTDDSYWGDQ